ncbi:nucleotide-diphospho-sugar transferase, partial [Lindgomyces ingoldianus]
DPYFISVRLLTYQIMHAEKTRTKFDGVPFLVLVLPQVPKSQTDVLKKEGATIVEVQPLDLPDLFDKNYIMGSRFRDVLSKLRLWQLTDYERVLYLDADSFLLERLDGLFLDERYSDDVEGNSHGRKVFEPPEEFIMAASTDTYGDQTEWEQPGHVNYLCACFMLFAPSEQMFDYYRYVLTGPDAPPNAAYPEQDLLIYVHRLEGQMPWTRIPIEWSANDGEMVDELVGGVKSLHVKGW